jgi:PAS domain S-box-containing protein
MSTLITAALALVVCALLGGAATVQWQQYESQIAETGKNAQNLAAAIEAQVSGSVDAVDIALAGLARTLPLLPAAQRPGDDDIHALLRANLGGLPFVRALWVTNATGDIVHDTDRLPVMFNFDTRAYFVAQRDNPSQGLFLGPPIADAKGVWFVSASRRINYPDGRFAGVVVAAIDPLKFEAFFASINTGKSGSVALTTPDSLLIARSPPATALVGTVVGDAAWQRKVLDFNSPDSFAAPGAVDGMVKSFAVRPVPDRPLVVVVGLGQAEALAPWRASSLALGAAALALSALIAALGYLVWRELNRSRALSLVLQDARLKADGTAQELAAVLDAIPDLMFEMDLDGRIHGYRTQRNDLLAAPPEVFLGKLLAEVLPPEATATCLAALQQAHAQGFSTGMQYEVMIGPEPKWFEASVAPKAAAEGQAPHFVFLSRDITARRLAESGLRTSTELLEYSQAAAKVGGWELTVATGHLYWTAETYRIHETTPAECNPTVDAAVTYYLPESRRTITAALQAAMAHGQGYDLELEAHTTEGRLINVRTTCTVTLENGKPAKLTGIFQDITAFKQALKAQNASNAQLRLLEKAVANLNDIVLITEAEPFDEPGHRIVFVNDAFVRRTGYSREEVMGRTPRILQGPKTKAAELARIGTALRKWEPVRAELINYTKSGEEFWLELDIVPVADDNGSLTHWVAVERDITERKASEMALLATNQELARSNAELAQFASVASHDLQEPLRAVSSCVQLLQKRYAGRLDARADEFIAHAVGGSLRMQTLIDDLLLLSRVNAAPRVHSVIDSAAALKAACANLAEAIAQSSAQISHDALPRVQADPGQLAQLLQNLIGNAIKFRGKQAAVVHVAARRDGADWVFSVADQGIGIEPPYFSRIFELFKRLHTRDEYAGTGIGLAICRKIVERHGGRIWVESAPGQGATFYFTLPAGDPSIAPTSTSPTGTGA